VVVGAGVVVVVQNELPSAEFEFSAHATHEASEIAPTTVEYLPA
jgi:hypothetical protein